MHLFSKFSKLLIYGAKENYYLHFSPLPSPLNI